MFTFKRWFHAEYIFRDERIGFDLKHLTAFEEREVRTRVVRAMGAIEGLKTVSDQGAEAIAEKSAKTLEKMGESLPVDFTREVFEKYVKNVSGVLDEDGTVRTDGSVILEFADDAFLWFVLLKLLGNGKVSDEEGKASGSPSVSVSVTAASGGTSHVMSTGNGDGGTPSTATAIFERSPSGGLETIQAT